jgi:hypothetical protein
VQCPCWSCSASTCCAYAISSQNLELLLLLQNEPSMGCRVEISVSVTCERWPYRVKVELSRAARVSCSALSPFISAECLRARLSASRTEAHGAITWIRVRMHARTQQKPFFSCASLGRICRAISSIFFFLAFSSKQQVVDSDDIYIYRERETARTLSIHLVAATAQGGTCQARTNMHDDVGAHILYIKDTFTGKLIKESSNIRASEPPADFFYYSNKTMVKRCSKLNLMC